MSKLQIFIDVNFPRKVVDLLEELHRLQKEQKFSIIRWENQNITEAEYSSSIVLLMDQETRGLSIPVKKHHEEGMRVIVCKKKKKAKLDRFELALTLFRVWPSIVDKAKEKSSPFIYKFNYGGRRLTAV